LNTDVTSSQSSTRLWAGTGSNSAFNSSSPFINPIDCPEATG
jgi:hypothetical protein